ncbi:MAG: hypothetical protein IK000_01020, partial [Bacteroidaceae bacterium]|nr:hypothetical protein [Bacteroidaceae bacterium]
MKCEKLHQICGIIATKSPENRAKSPVFWHEYAPEDKPFCALKRKPDVCNRLIICPLFFPSFLLLLQRYSA